MTRSTTRPSGPAATGDRHTAARPGASSRALRAGRFTARSAAWRADLAELLTRLATGFVHRPAVEVDAGLTGALGAVGCFLGADRAYLYRTCADRRQLVVAHEWFRPGLDPMPADRRTVRLDEQADLATALRSGQPAEPEPGAILLPLRTEDRLLGAVRFDALGQPPWPPETARHLLPFGDICASTLAAQLATAGLETSELRHRSVLDEITDVVVRLAPDGTLSYVNRAWRELTGNPVADTVGLDPMANVHPDDRVLAAEHLASTAAGRPSIREVRFLNHDGSLRWMEVSGRAVFDADGNLAGFSGLLHDVTERRESQARVQIARDEAERAREEAEHARDEAEAARDQAERASRAKSEFLSRMSHELRTPLNAVLGFSQLLGGAGLSGEDADNLEMISRAGRHLLDVINDALEVSRIESGRLPLSLEPVEITDVLAESAALIRPAATARKIELCLPDAARPSARRGPQLLVDRRRFSQVLINLLSNAVKYNRDGGRVEVAWRELPPVGSGPSPAPGGARSGGSPFAAGGQPPHPERPAGWLRIEVTDTGPGIPADRCDDVFLPFERLGAQMTGVEGSGVGLTMAKTLVAAMGGRIGVTSEVGRGSTFHVDLPLHERAGAAPKPPARDPAPDGITHTVLYIEDNPSNLTLMRRIFARRPHVRLLSAADADGGLASVRAHRPDLVLLDLHLPSRDDGMRVLLELRDDPDPRLRTTAVVMVTADVTPGTERRLMDAGATAFLGKPIDIAGLLQTVDHHLLALTHDPAPDPAP